MAQAKRSDGDARQQLDEKGRIDGQNSRVDQQTRAINPFGPSSRGGNSPEGPRTLSRMTDPDANPRPSWRGLLLAGAALAWMAAMLWAARATITGRTDAEMEVTSTAYAL